MIYVHVKPMEIFNSFDGVVTLQQNCFVSVQNDMCSSHLLG